MNSSMYVESIAKQYETFMVYLLHTYGKFVSTFTVGRSVITYWVFYGA